ncbi:MAG: hypothetical protein Q4E59_05670 [Bacteroidales bacterium]|nr:hypothetical protein [Bacteroidales bacterium]
MTQNDYQQKRDKLLAAQEPYRVFAKEEVFAQGDNIYKVCGTSFAVSAYVQQQLDRHIGLKAQQKKGLRQTYGEETVTDFRNMLASCVKKPEKFALIANTKDGIVDGIVPVKDEPVPMEAFFSVLETFADKNSYEIRELHQYQRSTMGIVAKLYPVHPEYDVFFEDDEFMKNGFYMRWDLGGMEIGNYIERLVCSNGATELQEHRLNAITNIASDSVRDFISNPMGSGLYNRNIKEIKENALIANASTASLNELFLARRMMLRNGVEDAVAEDVTGFNATSEMYKQAGVEHGHSERMMSQITVWQLFNRLTDFASHTEIMAPDDIRRTDLMQGAMRLLFSERDIKQYINIFK